MHVPTRGSRCLVSKFAGVFCAIVTCSLAGCPFLLALFDQTVVEESAAGGVNFMRVIVDDDFCFPHNEATLGELAQLPPHDFAGDFFVPAQLGNVYVVAVLSHALRAESGDGFSAGLTDSELLELLEKSICGLQSEILEEPSNVFTKDGKKALFQVHDTETGNARRGSDFDKTVSLLDNVQLLIGLMVAEQYLRNTAFSDPGGKDPLAIADKAAAAIDQFDIGMWYDGAALRLGGPDDPLAGSLVDRITSESRLAPVLGLALGHLTQQQFQAILVLMITDSKSFNEGDVSVEKIPFFGTALESYAVIPYLSGEMQTVYGSDTLRPLVDANIQFALQNNTVPAAGATLVATGLGTAVLFGHSPAEGNPPQLNANVLVFPAAGMMVATGTESALQNFRNAVASAKQAGLYHPTFGLPNAQDFGDQLVNNQNPVWGTLEILQMTVALLNHELGGDFVENLLRNDPGYDAALAVYLASIDN